MTEVTKNDLFEVLYCLLGSLSILFGVATGDLFFFFFTFIFLVTYAIHAWMGIHQLKMGFFFKRKLRELEFKTQEARDKFEMKKFSAILDELKEIKQLLKKR